MGRFDISPEVAEEYRAKFRETVAQQLDEQVLAVGPFRPTGAGTKYGISKMQGGALPRSGAPSWPTRRGSLPDAQRIGCAANGIPRTGSVPG